MTVADLIDLEAQLARDRDVDHATLAARDRRWIGAAAEGERRDALLSRWVTAARDADPARLHPGVAVDRAIRITRALLVVAGLVLGWASATGVLAFAGEHPVNVWDFLLVFVGAQVLLLAALLASFFLPLGAFGRPAAGLVRGAIAWAYARAAARSERARDRGAEWRALWHRLRSRRSLYHRVEPWLLLGMTQGFGVAFNVGALVALLRLVVFSDLAFAWSTTLLDLDAPHFHSVVTAIAAPWSAFWPDAVPSLDLVAATRYSRLESAYLTAVVGRAARPEAVGGWWPFLAAALIFYGLLPRAVLLAVARVRTALLLRSLPLRDAELERLDGRLRAPLVDTRGTGPAEAASRGPLRRAARERAAAPSRCAVVLWRDVPATDALTAAVAAQAGAPVVAMQAAGGRDFEESAVDWTRVADGADPLVIVAESFEAPDRATLRFMRQLRSALGPERHLLVLLVGTRDARPAGPAAPAVRVWREGLAALEDPFVAVEPLRIPA